MQKCLDSAEMLQRVQTLRNQNPKTHSIVGGNHQSHQTEGKRVVQTLRVDQQPCTSWKKMCPHCQKELEEEQGWESWTYIGDMQEEEDEKDLHRQEEMRQKGQWRTLWQRKAG